MSKMSKKKFLLVICMISILTLATLNNMISHRNSLAL